MTRRSDSWLAPAERQILESVDGVEPPIAIPSANYQLAQQIRRLNLELERLTPDQQRDLMPDWHLSWKGLQRSRQTASTRDEELSLIDDWASHWRVRLGKQR
jgi:hypothetical protein